ncbi:MAG: YbaB/EbfC family nucleoid-associated protein [Myxococcales bacterium]|nr:YbaB/EbfC family nucleoid-associated protein [Myxococcales bacterium]MCB9704472.1 YbaB/EbfC family nucleoid-associated protein [Myxococcales bacterium]
MSDFDLGAMMRQAQQLRDQMEYMQKALESQTVEGSAAGGRVKVTATGGQRIVSITIDPAVLEEDREMIQDLVTAAVNIALDRSRDLAKERMGTLIPPGLMGPGGIPGL